jgi:hypothetical protein
MGDKTIATEYVSWSSDTSVWGVHNLNLGWDTDYPDWSFCVFFFFQFPQANARIVLQIRSWSLLSISIPIHYLHIIQCYVVLVADNIIR